MDLTVVMDEGQVLTLFSRICFLHDELLLSMLRGVSFQESSPRDSKVVVPRYG